MIAAGDASDILSRLMAEKLQRALGRPVPVARLVSFSNLLAVKDALPVKNVKELIAYAKAHPDQLSFGSPGAGGSPHVAMVQFAQMADIKLIHAPYKGAAPARTPVAIVDKPIHGRAGERKMKEWMKKHIRMQLCFSKHAHENMKPNCLSVFGLKVSATIK